MYKTLIIFATVTLAGCSNFGYVSSNYDINDSSKESGIVVGSFTLNEDFYSRENIVVKVDKAVKTESGEKKWRHYKGIQTCPAEEIIFNYIIANQFNEVEGVEGRVFAIKLPAGYYNFSRWTLLGGWSWRPVTSKIPLTPKEFLVEKNKIVYVGNIHFAMNEKKTLPGFIKITGIFPLIQDERARDLAVFKELYPKWKNKEIDIRILPTGNWGAYDNDAKD